MARIRQRPTPWQFTLALAAIPLVAVFVVPSATARIRANRLYKQNQAKVAAARDAAPAQSKEQLATGITDALTASAARPIQSERLQSAQDALVRYWHPGVLRNDDVYGVTPIDSWRHEGRPGVEDLIREAISLYYHDDSGSTWGTGRLGPASPGDAFTAEWHGRVDMDEIEEESGSLLVFFEDMGGFEPNYDEGKPLFPRGRYHELEISRSRGDETSDFLRLYAVDDGGKWWLVGVSNPNLR